MQPHRRRAKTPAIWIRSLLTLALLVGFGAPAWAAPDGPQDLPCDEVTWDAVTGWPATLRACQTDATGDGDAAERVSAFLSTNHAALGIDHDLANLPLVTTRHSLAGSHLVYQQTLAGRPVYGAYLSVHLDADGQIQVLHNRTRPGLRLDPVAAPISAVQAVQQARTAILFGAPRGSNPAPAMVVLPLDGERGRLVWQVMISAAQPQGDWEVLLDAETGQVIKRYNRLVLARGQVFGATPAQQGPLPRGAAPLLRSVTLQGLDGSGWLRGEYVDVTQPAGYRPATAFSSGGDFVYQSDDPRFKEVMVYYHIDAAQRYIQSLGYSDRNEPPNGIRDRATHASPHWFAQDQSFYSVSDDALHFGDGGWPDALDADIIVHEYGHALLHDLAPHWGGGEMAAIGEGFGDYLAATLSAEAGEDPACIGELDSRGYAAGAATCLRRVDRDRQYPADVTGDAHHDGEIWSRVLWDLRAALGPATADGLALESNFYLPPAATLVEAGQALLDANASLYDGQHRAAIERALQARGLASLPAPLLTSPLGMDVLTPDGLWPVTWQAQTDLPVSYQVQWSLDATAAGTRRIDFERALPADFAAYGVAPWQVDDGAARSGEISHGQSSSLVLPVETVGDGRLSFRYRVDSEQGYDWLEFLIDGRPLLQASGLAGWRTFEVELPAGQHELVWRYSKDSTLNSGQDAAWIEAIVVEQASLARWQPVELAPGRSVSGDVLWRIPNSASSAASLRVRAELGSASSSWAASAPFTIDQPTAVSLASFEAGVTQALAGWPALLLMALAGLFLGLVAWRAVRRGCAAS